MSYRLSADSQYKKWVVELKSKIGAAQIKAAMTVNRQLGGAGLADRIEALSAERQNDQ